MEEPPIDRPRSLEEGQLFQPVIFTRPERAEELPPARRPPPEAPAGATTRTANDSHVRLCVQDLSLPGASERDAHALLDELCEEQLTLGVDLACFEDSILARAPDASRRMLEGRLEDLCGLRDALADVQLGFVDSRLPRVLVPDSALAEYLRGIYAWTDAILRALEAFARSARGNGDWALAACHLDEAKNFHFDELHEAIRADLLALAILAGGPIRTRGAARSPLEVIQAAVEHLLATAIAVEEGIDEAFG